MSLTSPCSFIAFTSPSFPCTHKLAETFRMALLELWLQLGGGFRGHSYWNCVGEEMLGVAIFTCHILCQFLRTTCGFFVRWYIWQDPVNRVRVPVRTRRHFSIKSHWGEEGDPWPLEKGIAMGSGVCWARQRDSLQNKRGFLISEWQIIATCKSSQLLRSGFSLAFISFHWQ